MRPQSRQIEVISDSEFDRYIEDHLGAPFSIQQAMMLGQDTIVHITVDPPWGPEPSFQEWLALDRSEKYYRAGRDEERYLPAIMRELYARDLVDEIGVTILVSW